MDNKGGEGGILSPTPDGSHSLVGEGRPEYPGLLEQAERARTLGDRGHMDTEDLRVLGLLLTPQLMEGS